MLFVDMICVQWRHAGKNGRIIVRGTNNVLLFECTLVPQLSGPRKGPKHASANTMSHDATDNSGVCCYHHTQSCRGDLHHHGKNSGQEPRDTSYAVSVGLNVKEHPIVTILYQERFSEQEHSVGTVDVEYNKLLFKKGFFADSVMQAQGYGVLLLCHSLQENPDGLTRRAFVNWRQCDQLMRQHIRTLAFQTAPPITTVVDTQDHKKCPEQVEVSDKRVGSMSSDRQWDISLYKSLKESVSSTFNLLL